MPDDIEPYPEARLRDRARQGVNVGIAAIPGIGGLGGPLELLLQSVLAPSIDKRRDSWFRTLGEAVRELQDRGVDVAALTADEPWVSAVFTASRIAMGTHLEEKLNQLKNCLVHMALDTERDDFLDLQLFTFVEDLSPEHFVVLGYLADPTAWYEIKGLELPVGVLGGSAWQALQNAQLPIDGMALDIVLRQLNDRGLADVGNMKVMVGGDSVFAPLATDLGRELLAFVREV